MKPSISFISPVTPSFSGNGLAMRAAHSLQALATQFEVHAFILPFYGGTKALSPEITAHLASWRFLEVGRPSAQAGPWRLSDWLSWGVVNLPPEWHAWNRQAARELQKARKETGAELTWLFRFYLLPWIREDLCAGRRVCLDLDELESESRQRQSQLYRQTGDLTHAHRLEQQARQYRGLEKRFLKRFAHVTVSSERELACVQRIALRVSASVWPNIVAAVPEVAPTATEKTGPRRLLFVGSMGHYPNRDAVIYAASEILLRLQAIMGERVVLVVAGTGLDPQAFAGLKALDLRGPVADLAPLYAEAEAVVVPLRSGGGTRIKILEAFAHRKAVVSTRIGAEGLNVCSGRELLLADDSEEFAQACAQVLRQPDRRNTLGQAGHTLWQQSHTAAVLQEKAKLLRQALVR